MVKSIFTAILNFIIWVALFLALQFIMLLPGLINIANAIYNSRTFAHLHGVLSGGLPALICGIVGDRILQDSTPKERKVSNIIFICLVGIFTFAIFKSMNTLWKIEVIMGAGTDIFVFCSPKSERR